MVSSLDKLAACIAKLPGVGRRSAERMALRLISDRDGLLRDLAAALQEAAAQTAFCSRCGGLTDKGADPCRLCMAPDRNPALLCVVEEAGDIALLERSGEYRGRYHVLGGKLSPIKGRGPEDLRLKDLLSRLDAEGIREVILALSTDVEGDATASWISERLRDRPVKVTRLAFGLPAGSGLAYSDPVTLARALRGRVPADPAP